MPIQIGTDFGPYRVRDDYYDQVAANQCFFVIKRFEI
jgi:hypothetical protein